MEGLSLLTYITIAKHIRIDTKNNLDMHCIHLQKEIQETAEDSMAGSQSKFQT